MSQPQPAKAKSSIFSSQPSIRIPTFQSPTVKAAPSAPIPQTRDEERQARLKGPVGAWNNLNALLPKGPQPLPSFGKRLGAPPPPPKQPAALSPTKRRSPAKPRLSQAEKKEREGTAKTTPPTSASATASRRASKARASTAAQQEEQQEGPVASTSTSKAAGKRKSSTSTTTAPRRASTNKPPPSASTSTAPTAPAAAAAKKRKSSIKPASALIEEEAEPEPEQEEETVASTSGAKGKGKGKRKSVAQALEEEEEEEPASVKPKKPTSKKRSRAAEEDVAEPPRSKAKASGKAASAPSKPKPPSSKSKRVRISDVPPPPPVVESYDDVMASTDSEAEAVDSYAEPSGMVEEEESEEEDSDEAEGSGKRKKGTKVRTERLKGNKGRLNAVDVVYGGVRKLLGRKISTLAPTSRPARSLTRYSTILQILLLTRSDQLSTLSTSSAAVSTARAKARQLRTELLGVQRARAGVGKRMREEEEGWKESRKRVETTRDLHSFLNDLSAASLDWQAPPPEPDSAPSPSDDFQPRLERLAALLGPVKAADKPSKKGKGKAGAKEEATGGLVARVQRLNAELRMER
ncbi:hypothetical protein BCR35DRAFT_303579 [Leucosporidium creatinivorum]|uniref:Uncharacterized protein n=1 Tax=Leucosporidium creatinivorum TaxID=106004 RepID=A0A1Y2FH42_9BASI|nr:hypothetical protein BCR35DRAFT_303579 [Leucosporidium creatinivorum]